MYLVKTGSLPSRCHAEGREKRRGKDKKLHLERGNPSVGHRIGAPHIAFIRALSLGER